MVKAANGQIVKWKGRKTGSRRGPEDRRKAEGGRGVARREGKAEEGTWMGRMDRMEAGRWERSELHVDERDESFAPAGAIWEEDVIVRWGRVPRVARRPERRRSTPPRVATARRPAGTRRQKTGSRRGPEHRRKTGGGREHGWAGWTGWGRGGGTDRGHGRCCALKAQAPSCGWGDWGKCFCFSGPGASASGSHGAECGQWGCCALQAQQPPVPAIYSTRAKHSPSLRYRSGS